MAGEQTDARKLGLSKQLYCLQILFVCQTARLAGVVRHVRSAVVDAEKLVTAVRGAARADRLALAAIFVLAS